MSHLISNKQAELQSVILPSAFIKYVSCREIKSAFRQVDKKSISLGKKSQQTNLPCPLPGIKIIAAKKAQAIAVRLDHLHFSRLAFSCNTSTILDALLSLQSISELDDKRAADKGLMAKALHEALRNYLLSVPMRGYYSHMYIYLHDAALLTLLLAMPLVLVLALAVGSWPLAFVTSFIFIVAVKCLHEARGLHIVHLAHLKDKLIEAIQTTEMNIQRSRSSAGRGYGKSHASFYSNLDNMHKPSLLLYSGKDQERISHSNAVTDARIILTYNIPGKR